MTELDIENAISSAQLRNPQKIIETIRPSIKITTELCEQAEITIGQSRLGGAPDLPEDFIWPSWQVPADDLIYGRPNSNRTSPTPLDFLAQIKLSDIAAYPGAASLPSSGWLCFFYLIESHAWGISLRDKGSSTVSYIPDTVNVKRRSAPPATTSLTFPSKVKFDTLWSIDDSLQVGDDDFDAYWDLKEELSPPEIETDHRLLGNPMTIQSAMPPELANIDQQLNPNLKDDASEWHLLFQIDSDLDGPGWTWGDAGHIYYWIKNKDLANLDFDRHWLIYQCY